jgi:signal transduction histidine kinase
VLGILLENARHYGGGGEIALGLDRATEGWRLSVADRGPGMSDAEKAGAFERFYRGPQAADRYGEGVGLGLPVAKSIVEAHGGTLTLEDRDGGGLVAVVMLPLTPKLRLVS